MKTLIIPCGGKSSRFPNMKPKYLLTHPDGSLMIAKSLSGINMNIFDRVIITIVKQHDEDYGSKLILEQIFYNNDKNIEICILDDFTTCQAETVIKTIEKKHITGEIVIKDSDNYVEISNINEFNNAIVGLNIETFYKEINRLSAKSFLIVNDQGFIVDIIEKKIKSQFICIGIYCFSDVDIFIRAYNKIKKNNENNREIYLSHVISYIIGLNEANFKFIEAQDYEDWGTLDDWKIVQQKYKTYFIDLDGVLLKNRGKYGLKNWSNSMDPLIENISIVKDLYSKGAQIIITTSREEIYRENINKFFDDNNIKLHGLIMGCNHSCRVIVNDFAPTNPYPSCEAINIKRNGDLSDYLF
ncbi:conserved hypothetical protein [Treponema primitia ZAS-2]|uniref:MobA-like NTP transferase domain-containing protein n=1 Tax=Treponema primitia (strain ATCC BAA-887 / DSM 12427 / ZAS-2) TaxID=545694 RepID=F5YQA1_TREPZ|nr:hypothetical protein [Treponema primitia]AEF86512.1 conserved hypothetical protein [Treponema primitia ZAS-2]